MATTANIMSVSPQAASGRTAAVKTGSRSSASGMKEFHRIFGKSAMSKDVGTGLPEKMAKDPISAAIAATAQQSAPPQEQAADGAVPRDAELQEEPVVADSEQLAHEVAQQTVPVGDLKATQHPENLAAAVQQTVSAGDLKAGQHLENLAAAVQQTVSAGDLKATQNPENLAAAIQQTVSTRDLETMQNPEDLAAAFLKASGKDTVPAAQLQTLMPQSAEAGQKSQSMLDLLSEQGWKQADTLQERQMPASYGAQQPLMQQTQAVGDPKLSTQGEGRAQTNMFSEVPVAVVREDVKPKFSEQAMPQTAPMQRDVQPLGESGTMMQMAEEAEVFPPEKSPMKMQVEAIQTEQKPMLLRDDSVESGPVREVSMASGTVREVSVTPEAVRENTIPSVATVQGAQASEPPRAEMSMTAQQADSAQVGIEPLRQLHQQQDMNHPSQQDAESGREQAFRHGNGGPAVQQPQAAENLPPSAQQNAVNFQQSMQNVQTGGAVDTQAPASQLAQDFDIPEQIVEQARLIRRTENTEMVIRLKPEHLGELTLKVTVAANGSVNASFHSDNAQVRAIIENSLVQLKQELSNQGIKVDNVEVSAELNRDGLLNGQGQQAWQQGQQNGRSQAARSQSLDFESFEEESAELAAVSSGQTLTEEGVDYRV